MHLCPDEFNALLFALEHFPFIGNYVSSYFRELW
jgi:hypothetical protein